MIRELGVGGVAVESGDHVCGFYYGEAERNELLLGYLSAGLRDGDKCIGVLDSSAPEQVVGDLASYLTSKQLEIWGSAETYLRTGEFVPDDMMGFWDRHVRAAVRDGDFEFARVVGEMSWLARVGLDRKLLIYYESWAQRFAPTLPQTVLCLYDLGLLGGGILVDILKTHPKVLLGGLMLENPHYMSPDELAAAGR